MMFRLTAVCLVLAGLLCLTQAQVPMTGAGKAIPTAGGGGSTVALDAAGTVTQFSGNTTLNYTGITVGSGSNRALVASLSLDSTADVTPSATWDSGGTNQSMTQIATLTNAGTNSTIYLYGLVAPTAGNKTLAWSWTGSKSGYSAAIAWTGVDQTGGTTSFTNPQTVFSGGASPVALTTTGGSQDASTAAEQCGGGVHVTATNVTVWYANSSGPGGNSYGQYKLGVGSISNTIDGGLNCVMAAVTVTHHP